jgi:hypothetical protein
MDAIKTPQVHSIENIENEYMTIQRGYSPTNKTTGDPESKRRT